MPVLIFNINSLVRLLLKTIGNCRDAEIGKQDEKTSSGRVIGDAGWSGFTAKLAYKAVEKGVHLVKLDQWFASTKSCHCCDHKMPEKPLNKCIWQCPECGIEYDRDINVAISIRQKGVLELQATGSNHI